MLTAEKIEEMLPEERLRRLEAYAAQALPGFSIARKAKALGVAPRTWTNWTSKPATIPAMALMLLERMAFEDADTIRVTELVDVSEAMAEASLALRALARRVSV